MALTSATNTRWNNDYRKENKLMAGEKKTIEIELNTDQLDFIQKMKDNYEVRTESKIMRIIMDYLLENEDVHDTVFVERRCLRCG